jgi:hypothetical protein
MEQGEHDISIPTCSPRRTWARLNERGAPNTERAGGAAEGAAGVPLYFLSRASRAFMLIDLGRSMGRPRALGEKADKSAVQLDAARASAPLTGP